MDLRVSARGRFEIANGRFSVVTDRSELLSQYLRAAITNQLRSDTIPSITAAQVSNVNKLSDFKLELQRRLVEIVASSPFAYDFDISAIGIDIQRSGQDSLTVSISYNNGSNNNVIVNYSVNGGRLDLAEELDAPYNITGEIRLIEEEIASSDFIEEVDVSCEPAGALYVCEQGSEPKTENIVVAFSSVPEMDRIVAKNVSLDGEVFPVLGSRKSKFISSPTSGTDVTADSSFLDSIFLSSVLKNRGGNFRVTNVQEGTGDIRLIRYIPSVEDWLIEVSTENQTQVSVKVSYIEAIDVCSTYLYQDAKAVTQVDNYSFPNEAIRGRKYYRLNNVLSPGLYTVFYTGIVKPRYNGSIEEV